MSSSGDFDSTIYSTSLGNREKQKILKNPLYRLDLAH